MEILHGIAMTLWKTTRKISLELPEELLTLVDACANQTYMSRSEYIRQTLLRVAKENEAVMQKHLRMPVEDAWLDVE